MTLSIFHELIYISLADGSFVVVDTDVKHM